MDYKTKMASWERFFLQEYNKIDTFCHGFEFLQDLFKTSEKNKNFHPFFCKGKGVC